MMKPWTALCSRCELVDIPDSLFGLYEIRPAVAISHGELLPAVQVLNRSIETFITAFIKRATRFKQNRRCLLANENVKTRRKVAVAQRSAGRSSPAGVTRRNAHAAPVERRRPGAQSTEIVRCLAFPASTMNRAVRQTLIRGSTPAMLASAPAQKEGITDDQTRQALAP
jgi:hypothetical protein